MKHSPLLISCDWWQASVDASQFRWDHPDYNCQVLSVRSRTFQEVWNISRHGATIATLCRKPFSPRIPAAIGTLKIENYILYHENRCDIIDQITADLKLYVRGTTRIDVCGDFRRLCGKLPELVIRDILDERIYKVGHARCTTIGDQDSSRQHFTAYGTAGRTNSFSYLRYGSRSSRISTYLYNKTKELNEQHDKPYIRDMWAANGWCGDMNVWRLEYSIKGREMLHISKETGEVMPNNPKLWLRDDVMRQVYGSLCGHYFDLRQKTQVRKDREEKIPLWPDEPAATCLIKKLDANKHNNRADKIFIRKLAQMATETNNTELIAAAAALGREYCIEKRLGKWAASQGLTFSTPLGDLIGETI